MGGGRGRVRGGWGCGGWGEAGGGGPGARGDVAAGQGGMRCSEEGTGEARRAGRLTVRAGQSHLAAPTPGWPWRAQGREEDIGVRRQRATARAVSSARCPGGTAAKWEHSQRRRMRRECAAQAVSRVVGGLAELQGVTPSRMAFLLRDSIRSDGRSEHHGAARCARYAHLHHLKNFQQRLCRAPTLWDDHQVRADGWAVASLSGRAREAA